MLALALLAVPALPAQAAPWQFDPPLEVSGPPCAGVFHHLEAAGRRSIAVSAGSVAVAWEDNADGSPRCRMALRRPGQPAFDPALAVNDSGECYEPALTALADGRFALAWEQDGAVWARTAAPGGLGPAIRLATAGGQATLAWSPRGGLWAAWSDREGRFGRVLVARLEPAGDGSLRAQAPAPVDAQAPVDDQLYPTLAVIEDAAAPALAAAWEDRRQGHTVIAWSLTRDGRTFAPYRELNEALRGGTRGLGRGSGAMRPALAAAGSGTALAVWSDKRDFLSGYDVYASFSRDGATRFGANEKVQDAFGNDIAQWHPAVGANAAGRVAVAWDDDRDGSADIWLSWRQDAGWSDNLAVPGASGPGLQSDPALTLDEAGNLHLAWVQRDAPDGPTRIRYLLGRAGAP